MLNQQERLAPGANCGKVPTKALWSDVAFPKLDVEGSNCSARSGPYAEIAPILQVVLGVQSLKPPRDGAPHHGHASHAWRTDFTFCREWPKDVAGNGCKNRIRDASNSSACGTQPSMPWVGSPPTTRATPSGQHPIPHILLWLTTIIEASQRRGTGAL
jgi:hypothetical protein